VSNAPDDTANRILTFSPVLQRVGGKDASKQFWKYHNEGILKKYQKQLQVGSLDSKPKPEPKPEPKKAPPKPKAEPGTVSAAPTGEVEESVPLDPFGDLIPYADPNWYQSVSCH
jgi:hypothetical protein